MNISRPPAPKKLEILDIQPCPATVRKKKLSQNVTRVLRNDMGRFEIVNQGKGNRQNSPERPCWVQVSLLVHEKGLMDVLLVDRQLRGCYTFLKGLGLKKGRAG